MYQSFDVLIQHYHQVQMFAQCDVFSVATIQIQIAANFFLYLFDNKVSKQTTVTCGMSHAIKNLLSFEKHLD